MPRTDRALSIIRRMADGTAVLVVALALGALVLGRVLPLLGHQVFVVAGPSMGPAIDMGSAIVLDTVEPEALAVGDVVSLRSGPEQAIFTHRIVRVVEREGVVWIETKGDANPAPDPSITPASAVIGRASVSIPYAGYLIALLSVPSGIVFVIALGLVLVTLAWWLDGMIDDRRTRAGLGVIAVWTVPRTVRLTSPAHRRRRARLRAESSGTRRP
jgi:signal peptidase